MSWDEVAAENRGLAEAIVVLAEYRGVTEQKEEMDMVLKRLTDRFDWTVYTLKQLEKDPTTKGTANYIDPDRETPAETSA
jgi:hypothetical protein